MALDIYLQQTALAPRVGDDCELIAQLEDDGYYWFLWPLFEQLQRETGQTIDLYGDAIFSGDNFLKLKTTLTQAEKVIETQPKNWDVSVGKQTFPQQKTLYSTVEKSKFQSILNDLQNAVETAQRLGWYLAFWGD